jgi:hypothetical protein
MSSRTVTNTNTSAARGLVLSAAPSFVGDAVADERMGEGAERVKRAVDHAAGTS